MIEHCTWEMVRGAAAPRHASADPLAVSETVGLMLKRDLLPVGNVSVERRLSGVALLIDDVMFAYVDIEGVPYLRVTNHNAQRFHALGSRRHPEMPYWTIPRCVAADISDLRAVAYEAVDDAWVACS